MTAKFSSRIANGDEWVALSDILGGKQLNETYNMNGKHFRVDASQFNNDSDAAYAALFEERISGRAFGAESDFVLDILKDKKLSTYLPPLLSTLYKTEDNVDKAANDFVEWLRLSGRAQDNSSQNLIYRSELLQKDPPYSTIQGPVLEFVTCAGACAVMIACLGSGWAGGVGCAACFSASAICFACIAEEIGEI